MSQSLRSCGSKTSLLGMKPEMGLNVSNPNGQKTSQMAVSLMRSRGGRGKGGSAPFAVLQGSPLALTASWTFRAVMSIASAETADRKLISFFLRRAKGEERLGLTVAGDVVQGQSLGDVPARLTNHNSELDFSANQTQAVSLTCSSVY